MNEIDELKSRVNIVDVVGEKVRLKKSGFNYFGLCPFHGEKTPSFSVNEQLQIFKCFGCGESGDVIKFIEKTENLSFKEVIEELSEKTGFKLQNSKFKTQDSKFENEVKKLLELNSIVANFYHDLLMKSSNDGYEYSKKRNIEIKTIKKFKLGYASHTSQNLYTYLKQLGYDEKTLSISGVLVKKENKAELQDKFKDRLIFSVFDQKGNIVAFSGRYIGPSRPDFEPPKYLNSPETLVFSKSKTLFGLYQAIEAIKRFKFVIISEGQMNIISSNQIGVENIIASLGTSFTKDHLELLRRYTSTFYLAFDKDNAGKKALLRTIEMIFSADTEINCKIIYWDPKNGKDPDEVIQKDKKIWIDAVNSPMDPIEYLIFEFNNKFKSPSMEIKDSFLRTIVPLIDKHKNLFKKEEYLKKVAECFDVTPDQLKKTYLERGQQRFFKQQTQVIEKKVIPLQKRNSAVDSFFAIILQNWEQSKEILMGIERDFILDEYLEIFDCLSLYIDENDLNQVRNNLDEDSQKLFDELALMNVRIDDAFSIEEHLLKNIPNIIRTKYNEIVKKFQAHSNDNEILQLKNRLANALLEYARK